MTQQLPHKPGYLTDAEHEFILDRDRRRCALRDFCNRSGTLGVLEYCDELLEFDHHQPRALGGDDSFTNIRLLCASENRARPIEPSPYWGERNYWDGPFIAEKLRHVQKEAGYSQIIDDTALHGALLDQRNTLLQTTTLMVGATGTGKAITIFSVLFAINAVVNSKGPSRPRVRHALWLTTEETLRDMTREDLREDPYNIGLVTAKPIVRVATSYTDIERGPCGADIIVTCPHSLWWVKGPKEGVRRSDREIMAALSQYDTLVADECDFAGEQLQHIVALARHMLKFAPTASPPMMAGADPKRQSNLLSRFVLISDDAVADYHRAVTYDGCLKQMPGGVDNFIRVADHERYESLLRGIRDLVAEGKADPSHPVYQAAIIRAVIDADRMEQEMMTAMPDDWYSPHVIVRLDRIYDIKALMRTLPEAIASLKTLAIISGQGWDVTAVYQGHERGCPTDERDLAAKKDGKWRHPFMQAKDYRGRAGHNSKRVLLMINIGLRGLNNWPIQFVVDCTDRTSETEETQLRGRGIRLPDHLAKYWSTDAMLKYISMVTYIPQSVATDEKVMTLYETTNFLHNMLPIVSGAGFRTWSDIAAGVDINSGPPPVIDPSALPLTGADKLQLMAGLGSEIVQATTNNTDVNLKPAVEGLVNRLKPEATGRRRERAVQYVIDLIEKPDFRLEETFAPMTRQQAKTEPVRCVTHLKPKDIYTVAELIRKVQSDPQYAALRQEYVDRLNSGDPLIVHAVSQQHRSDDRISYKEPPRVFKLNATPHRDGALSGIVAELHDSLKKCDEVQQSDYGEVAKTVYEAAQNLFGVDDAQNDGPLDQHAYHVEIMGRQRNRIMKMALGLLAERGIVRNIAALGGYHG